MIKINEIISRWMAPRACPAASNLGRSLQPFDMQDSPINVSLYVYSSSFYLTFLIIVRLCLSTSLSFYIRCVFDQTCFTRME